MSLISNTTNVVGSTFIWRINMTINESLRLIAGVMILLSLYLAISFSINWLWFTAFIGVNLLQSSLTKWCPMMTILQKLGVKN